jgi:hypothetical protein
MVRDRKMPDKKPRLDVPLDKRVEYAIQVVDAAENDSHVEEAKTFLAAVQDRIQDPQLKEQVSQLLGGGTAGGDDSKDQGDLGV